MGASRSKSGVLGSGESETEGLVVIVFTCKLRRLSWDLQEHVMIAAAYLGTCQLLLRSSVHSPL